MPRRYGGYKRRNYAGIALAKRRARFSARYGARWKRGAILGRLGSRARFGGRVGAGLLAFDAMRAAGGAYRRYQRRSAPGTKRTSQVSGEWNSGDISTPDSIAWKTLYSYPLVDMDRGTGIRERLSGRVYIKGFKLCLRWHHTNTYPVEVHWAIIQEKVKADLPLGTDFFRSFSTTTTRQLNFTDRTGTGDVYDIRYLCNPINASRYNIITHRKFILRNKPTSAADANGMGWTHRVNTYIPIKRKVTYGDDADLFNEKPWYLVQWWLPIEYNRFDSSLHTIFMHFNKCVYYSDGRL